MFFFNFIIILLNLVFISTAIIESNKKEQNDIKKEMKGERIIGGRFANDGEVPYQVLFLSNGRFLCGGVLIKTEHLTDRVIVTGAGCILVYDFYSNFILNFVNQILK